MNKGAPPIREEDLHAYVDDVIDLSRKTLVEDYLSRHPDVSARMGAHALLRERLREQLAPVTEEPIPPELNLVHMLEARRQRRGIPWRIAACFVLALGLGGVAGWNLKLATEQLNVGVSALAREAAANYRVYAADLSRPVEMPASDSSELLSWISRRLARPIVLPHLASFGYHFIGGRLVATEHGPAGLFLYEDGQGTRLAIMVRPMDKETSAPMSSHAQPGVSGYTWIDQGLGYDVMGPDSVSDIHPVANEVRRQTDAPPIGG